jgi:MORN repeat variant
LVWALSNNMVNLNGLHCTWTNYFRENHFLASVDSIQRTAIEHPSQLGYKAVPEYCNDLDALWKLEELEQVMKFGQEDTDEEATRFHLNNHGEAFGKMVQGFPEGTWNLYNDKHKLILTVDFASGVEHGVFRSYDDEGDLIEKGHFAFGLREGEWITYHPNGQENTRRNYFRGWMRGKQLAFYDNGKPRLEYYYENHIIHGPFREWYRDGLVKQEGSMIEGIRIGQWNFNIRLPQDYIDYVLNHGEGLPDPHWNGDVLKDRILSYSCNIEKENYPGVYKDILYHWKLIGEIK